MERTHPGAWGTQLHEDALVTFATHLRELSMDFPQNWICYFVRIDFVLTREEGADLPSFFSRNCQPFSFDSLSTIH